MIFSIFLGLFLHTEAFAVPEMIPETDTDLLGRSAPEFKLPTFKGSVIELNKLRGKVVVLSFWASWCSPCRFELPELSRIRPLYPNVEFIAVNVDRERSPAERFLKRFPFELPIAWDTQAEILGQYAVISMPTLMLIDKNGTIKYIKVGYSKEKKLAELETKIKELK